MRSHEEVAKALYEENQTLRRIFKAVHDRLKSDQTIHRGTVIGRIILGDHQWVGKSVDLEYYYKEKKV